MWLRTRFHPVGKFRCRTEFLSHDRVLVRSMFTFCVMQEICPDSRLLLWLSARHDGAAVIGQRQFSLHIASSVGSPKATRPPWPQDEGLSKPRLTEPAYPIKTSAEIIPNLDCETRLIPEFKNSNQRPSALARIFLRG